MTLEEAKQELEKWIREELGEELADEFVYIGKLRAAGMSWDAIARHIIIEAHHGSGKRVADAIERVIQEKG